MKKTIIIFALSILLGFVCLAICGQGFRRTPFKRTDYYLQPLQDFPPKDSTSTREGFRQQALFNLRDNENVLTDLNAKVSCANKQVRARYFSLLLELQQRNNGLRNRMSAYQACSGCNQAAFESAFDEDMYRLRRTIRDIRISNDMLI